MKKYVKPKKYLGQHFLNDKEIAAKVASLFIEDLGEMPVLEIGPGMGVLTNYLIEHYKNLSVIEIDQESVDFLESEFRSKGLKIMKGDFLDKRIQADLFQEDQIIIGNFPYNISSQIVFKVLENVQFVKGFGGMFQKEVADRLVAGPGSKTYGIPSVLLNTFYKCSYAFTVGPEKFNPPPKVQSAVIKCVRKEGFVLPCSRSLFYDVVKSAFGQRRKTMRNALHKFNLKESHEFAKLRAEQLSSADFIQLTQFIEENK